ncbi:MAG: hypothetical protein OCC46_13065 [Pseudodesulfovibrio sp.]
MSKKIIVVDACRRKFFPADSLYMVSSIKDQIDLEDVSIYRLFDAEDMASVLQDLASAGERETVLFFWVYEKFLPVDMQAMLQELVNTGAGMANVTLVMGGLQPTLAKDLLLKDERIDYVLAGWSWTAPTDWLDGGKNDKPILLESPKESGLSDEIQLMDGFSRIRNLDKCVMTDPDRGQYFNYRSTYMCQNGCAFCHATHFLKHYGGLIQKSDERINEELLFLKGALGTDHVYLSSYVCDKSTIEYLRRAGMQIENQFDLMIKSTTPDLLDMFKDMGAECVFIGLENIQSDVQKRVGKHFDLEHFESILEYGDSIGMMFEGNIMVGLNSILGEPATAADIRRDIQTVIPYYRKHKNLRVLFRPYMPFIGTPLGDRLWEKTNRLEGLSFWDYLRLGYSVARGEGVPEGLPIPPSYADLEAFEVISTFYKSFEQLVRHKTSLYKFPPKNPDKAKLCEEMSTLCYGILESGNTDFADFLENSLDAISRWR